MLQYKHDKEPRGYFGFELKNRHDKEPGGIILVIMSASRVALRPDSQAICTHNAPIKPLIRGTPK